MKHILEYNKFDITLIAPNGKKSNLTKKQWHQVRTEEFKNWFGDWENNQLNASKVLDENGEPLVVYHSTNINNKFKIFNTNNPCWFTRAEQYAKAFNDKLYKTYLSLRNPIFVGDIDGLADKDRLNRLSKITNIDINIFENILKETNGIHTFNITNSNKFKELLIDRGYDGIEAKEGGGLTTYAIFIPNQIKSATNNNGDFDPNNENITK